MGKKRMRDNFDNASYDNNLAYRYYLEQLVQLAVANYEWENMPDTIDQRYLNLSLLKKGWCIFFKDDVCGYLALRCRLIGTRNVYGIEHTREAYGDNGYHKTLTSENSVIIYDNLLHTTIMPYLEYYARRLANLERIIDVNCDAQRTPIILQGSEEERLSLINFYMRMVGNFPFIGVGKNMNMEGVKVLNVTAPFVSDKILSIKNQLWSEILTFIGISNLNVTKKERLLTDEITNNMGATIASRFGRVASKQTACDEINNMFGLNIKFVFKSEEDYMSDRELRNANKYIENGGEENERIHNTTEVDS